MAQVLSSLKKGQVYLPVTSRPPLWQLSFFSSCLPETSRPAKRRTLLSQRPTFLGQKAPEKQWEKHVIPLLPFFQVDLCLSKIHGLNNGGSWMSSRGARHEREQVWIARMFRGRRKLYVLHKGLASWVGNIVNAIGNSNLSLAWLKVAFARGCFNTSD